MQVYNRPKSDGTPDLEHGSIAIQADLLGQYAQNAADQGYPPSPEQKWYAFGAFATAEPEGNFCRVPTTVPAKVDVPEVPAIEDDASTPDEDESYPGDPAISLEYAWSDVQFYVTTDLLGTVMRGNVKVTIDGNACEYSAVGVYPHVTCAKTVTEDARDPDDPSRAASCAAGPEECDRVGKACDENNVCKPCWVPEGKVDSNCKAVGASCDGIVCKVAVECLDSAECTQYGAVCNGGVCERADQKLCDPAADPDNGYALGSGISPEVPMMCDQSTMTCIPNGTPPMLR
jgi:hypothetical protein